MKIGNWLITPNAIVWNGIPNMDYEIERSRLLELGLGERDQMYDWLIHLTEKSWITNQDIYTLNTAFIYAIESWGLNFNDGSWVKTLTEQQKHLR